MLPMVVVDPPVVVGFPVVEVVMCMVVEVVDAVVDDEPVPAGAEGEAEPPTVMSPRSPCA